MKITQGAHRQAFVAITATVLAVGIAACGSSGGSRSGVSQATTSTTTTTATSGASSFAAQRTKRAACLKAHGVSLPSRPAGGYGGGYGRAPGSGNGGGPYGGGGYFGGAARNSKFSAAFKACAAEFPAGARGRLGAGRARFTTATLDAFVKCVKQHGYTLPTPNTSGKGPVFPTRIEHNAKFEAAAKSCESILRPSFRGPGGGAPGGGSAGGGSAGGGSAGGGSGGSNTTSTTSST